MHKYTLSDLDSNIILNVIAGANCAGREIRDNLKDRIKPDVEIELSLEELGAIKLALVDLASKDRGATYAALKECAKTLKILKAFLAAMPKEQVDPVIALDDEVEE